MNARIIATMGKEIMLDAVDHAETRDDAAAVLAIAAATMITDDPRLMSNPRMAPMLIAAIREAVDAFADPVGAA